MLHFINHTRNSENSEVFKTEQIVRKNITMVVMKLDLVRFCLV